MFKRFLCIGLTLILALSVCIPVSAAGDNIVVLSESHTFDEENNKLSFVLKKNVLTQEYLLEYYYNDELDTEYEINQANTISARTVTGRQYELAMQDALIRNDLEQNLYQLGDELQAYYRPIHFCNITYKNSSEISGVAMASVEYETNTEETTYTINAYKDSKYADVVAEATGYIISFAVAYVAASTAPPLVAAAPSIAQLVINSMITTFGSSIVNELIAIPFNDTFDCIRIVYSYQATLSKGTTILGTTEMDNAGANEYVKYDNYIHGDQYPTDFTPQEIEENVGSGFARAVWNGCCDYTYPGYSKYSFVQVR